MPVCPRACHASVCEQRRRQHWMGIPRKQTTRRFSASLFRRRNHPLVHDARRAAVHGLVGAWLCPYESGYGGTRRSRRGFGVLGRILVDAPPHGWRDWVVGFVRLLRLVGLVVVHVVHVVAIVHVVHVVAEHVRYVQAGRAGPGGPVERPPASRRRGGLSVGECVSDASRGREQDL